jgi:hypothetical protein
MKKILIAVVAAALFAGCATNQVAEPNVAAKGENDARMLRGLLDSMASPAHNFPANLPR